MDTVVVGKLKIGGADAKHLLTFSQQKNLRENQLYINKTKIHIRRFERKKANDS